MSKEAYSQTAEAYAPSCQKIVRELEPMSRTIKREGVERLVRGIGIGQNGGLAFPSTPDDSGTVATFIDFVQQLGAEGLAESVETEIHRPHIATGTHSYLVREPLAAEDIGQYARLDLSVVREDGKAGRLLYEASLSHSCRPDEKLKAKNGAETDVDLWMELSRVFLG